MNFFKNLPIRYKLFVVFGLILVVFGVFSVYLLVTFSSLRKSVDQLNEQKQRLNQFLALDTETKSLSDSVKSYILTKDLKWEKSYNDTSVSISSDVEKLKPSLDTKAEIDAISLFEEVSRKIKGTELLILSKTREGNIDQAIKLFDNNVCSLYFN